MMPERLREVLSHVVAEAVSDGSLPESARAGPPGGPLFRPVDARTAGVVADWVSPVATRWAPTLHLDPRRLAQVLAQGLTGQPGVEAVEVTPSGLMALTLTDLDRAQIIETVFADEHYGCGHEPSGVEGTDADDGDDDELRSRHPAPTTNGPLPERSPLRPAQLAYARLRRVIRNAEAAGVTVRAVDHRGTLTHVAERLLQVALADLPQRLAMADGDPARQVRALTDLAALCDGCARPARPTLVGEEITEEHGVCLALAVAGARVLRNGLARLGADAPERM